jgi:hypothetical protein
MEWMSRILVGEMAGADEDFGMGYGQKMCLIFVPAPGTTYSFALHMTEMILSEPSIIIIWTY